MGLHHVDLDETTRQLMIAEYEDDLAEKNLYYSARLSPQGVTDWPVILRTALETGTDDTLAAEINVYGRLNPSDFRLGKPIKMNKDAHFTLAEGEFNRFFIRGVCLRAIEEGRRVVAYRARSSSEPRASSLAVDGVAFDPALVLADLRAHSGTDPQHGFPGPNSGMSVRLE